MILEKRCDTRERWQCRWFALFSLAAQSLVCVKVAWSLKSHCRPFRCIWLWQFEKWWWTRQEVSTTPFAAFSCMRISNDKGVHFWMQEQHWDNIPPDLCHNSYNSFLNQGKKETWKSFSLPSPCSVLISWGLARLLSITIAHLFSFGSPPVSPFNPFSCPPPFPLQLLSFQPDLSIFGNSYFCVTSLSLFTSSLTSSFSLPPTVCHPSPGSFNPTCLIFPSTVSLPDFSRCLSQYALTSSLSNAPSLPPVSAKPSLDQLSSLAWCLCLTLHTWS